MFSKNFLAGALLTSLLISGCGISANGSLLQKESKSSFSLASIDRAVAKTGVHQESSSNSIHLYVDGPEGYPALEEMIRSAKKAIYAEYFIWHNDKTGQNIADLLIEKKKQGLEVKVLIDTHGGHYNGDVKIIDRLRAAGIEVQRYPILSLAGIFGGVRSGLTLTHRKLMIVDGSRVMTGGMNIGNEYAEGEFHDLMLKVEGPAGHDLMHEFFSDWKRSKGSTPLWKDETVLRFGEERARIAVTSPTEKDRRQEWYDVLSSAIDSAQKEIDIESPYFSDDDLMVHLKAAAKRGVKVRVVMPVAHSESDLFKRLNIETTRQMIGTGVELRAYPGRFSHTKYVCIDDCWTAMGSANCDSRSLHENQENMVMVSGEAFATSAQARVFDKDWGIAQDVTKEIGSLKDQKKKIWSTILEILDYYL